MSGFSNQEGGGNSKYANFKEGLIVTKKNGQKVSFTTLEGDILDVDVEDAEFDKKPYRKVNVYIQHDEGVTILGFPIGSGYGQAFCKMLPNLNASLPVTISGGIDKVEGSPRSYGKMFIKQEGVSVKWFYTKSLNADKLPTTQKNVGTKAKPVWESDYTARNEFFEKLLFRFHENLAKVWPNGAATAKAAKGKAGVAENSDPADDLPF